MSVDLRDKWQCEICTYDNPTTIRNCEVCLHVRTVDIGDNEYDSKIEFFEKDMLMNFLKLDQLSASVPELPFEDVINSYTRERDANVALDKWYSSYYSNKKPEPSDKNKLNKIPYDILNRIASEKEVWDVIIKKELYTSNELRMLIVELGLDSPVKMYILRTFISNPVLGTYLKNSSESGNVKLSHIKQAISDQVSVEGALNFLQRECSICCGEFPIPEMRRFVTCQHTFCKDCFLGVIKEMIKSKYPIDWNCPLCTKERCLEIDKIMLYSQFRDILAEDKLVLHILEDKLVKGQIRQSPNFHWCANEKCVYGFEAEGIGKFQCPTCDSYMCLNCNRMWQTEHEGKTCGEFELWMLKNGDNLSEIMEIDFMECPGCGIRYALAAGGSLHFDCKVCGIKFCGGCYQLLVDKCDKPNCPFTNFHGHHSRNCLYFLRDYFIDELEDMLKTCDYPKLQGKREIKCQFTITDNNLKERLCNMDVYATTGLCETHYKEHLVLFINRYKIDPADFADNDSLNLMLFHLVLPRLQKAKTESITQFKERLQKAVKENCLFYIPKGANEIQ